MKDRNSLIYVGLALSAMLLQFICFKLYFPYADIVNDSNNYLESAYYKMNCNFWPVGYPILIRFVWLFSRYDVGILFFQYLIYNLCALYFFYSMLRIDRWKRWTIVVLFLLLFCNPLILSINNYILSDTVFIGLSLLWIAQLYNISNSSKKLLLILAHLTVIIALILVKYQAFYYPFVSIIVIWYKIGNLKIRMLFTSLLISLLTFYFLYSKRQLEKEYNVSVFSPLGSWQIANNAIEAYNYSDWNMRSSTSIPSRFKYLDDHVRCTNKSSMELDRFAQDLSGHLSSIYIWNPNSPLQTYGASIGQDCKCYLYGNMIRMSKLYQDYGLYLINEHKFDYFKHFIIPNSYQYFFPDQERVWFHSSMPNLRIPMAKICLKFINLKVGQNKSRNFFDKCWLFMPISIFWLFLSLAAWVVIVNDKNNLKGVNDIKFITLIYFVFNFIFSVVASPIVLRCQVFNISIGLIISLMIFSKIIDSITSKE